MAFPTLAVLAMGGLVSTLGLTAILTGAAGGGGEPFRAASARPPSAAPATPHAMARAGRQHAAGRPGSEQAAFADWAAVQAQLTGVPARALEAYAGAARRTGAESPGCRLSWATLAGIGFVESRNGQLGGGLRPSGRPRVPIYGVQLDGAGPVAAIPDSDKGLIDGEPAVDRAVGPLQFLPSTWAAWGSDGDGDDVRDPQDIDDAALAAARYLCSSGDLGAAGAWTTAVLSYNPSNGYLASVYAATDTIAARSRG